MLMLMLIHDLMAFLGLVGAFWWYAEMVRRVVEVHGRLGS